MIVSEVILRDIKEQLINTWALFRIFRSVLSMCDETIDGRNQLLLSI